MFHNWTENGRQTTLSFSLPRTFCLNAFDRKTNVFYPTKQQLEFSGKFINIYKPIIVILTLFQKCFIHQKSLQHDRQASHKHRCLAHTSIIFTKVKLHLNCFFLFYFLRIIAVIFLYVLNGMRYFVSVVLSTNFFRLIQAEWQKKSKEFK